MNLQTLKTKIIYYFWATYRRKSLDYLQEKYRGIYRGIVFDIGGRDRGKFVKPKKEVEKWVFVDLIKDHNPDLVMDIANMDQASDNSVDVIACMEVLAHVEKIEKALDECSRILKKNGNLVFSVPCMHPVINDPTDFQRWTEMKWHKELTTRGFQVTILESTGGFFTLLGDMGVSLVKTLPTALRYFGYLFYPLLDGIVALDKTRFARKPLLSRYITGYFIIAEKK